MIQLVITFPFVVIAMMLDVTDALPSASAVAALLPSEEEIAVNTN